MKLDLRYLGSSGVRRANGSSTVSFAPNLARGKVFFDAEIQRPVRFREAISALHDVVVGDLRFQRKDKAAYQQWRAEQVREEALMRREVFSSAKAQELARQTDQPIAPGLDAEFRRMHGIYWHARRQWASELSRSDPAMFRALVPCDPLVTVAPDAVFFECFSKDESSYGCLLVDRNALTREAASGSGTTNVDYSLALYDHFQTLRSYRETRLVVDPAGFEVTVEGREDYREEKIDLPPSWLRGFGQLQAAMTLPTRRVTLPVEAVYGILAHLRRHREKTGPRCLRFHLAPGETPRVTLDPWGIDVGCHGFPYDGRAEEIKVWGRRRLMTLARILPLAEKVEVALLGTGLPSIWTVFMGEMRFVLALSGWTANDWTSGAALELMTAGLRSDGNVVGLLSSTLAERHKARLQALLDLPGVGLDRDLVLGSLHTLCRQGQAIYDFAEDCYRFRQVMPVALSEAVIGPEHPELDHGRRLYRQGSVQIVRDEMLSTGRRLVVAKLGGTECEGFVDADGSYTRAKCPCGYFFKNRLRGGPCRHLLALKLHLFSSPNVH